MRSRYWCLTDHDVVPWEQAQLRYRFTTREGKTIEPTYLILGHEICPTTGKAHLQGYVELNEIVSDTQIRSGWPGPHWESRSGTAAQASAYCKKEGQWHETGVMSKPAPKGRRTDLNEVRDMAINGTPMSEIVLHASSFQAIRMAEKIREYHSTKRDWKPYVCWYWGPTGCGKSHAAHTEAGPNAWTSMDTLAWWQHYDGHENVVIDDFRASFCKLSALLRILDKWPYTVAVKGGSQELLARRIWITCPYHPREVYDNADGSKDEAIEQLLRRIDIVRHFPTRYIEPAAPQTPTPPVDATERTE